MEKLLVISTNFRDEEFWKRWRILADLHKDLEVILFAPKKWDEGTLKQYTFGKVIHFSTTDYKSDNFRVISIDMRQNIFGDWVSKEIIRKIKDIKPNYMYFIGHHGQMAMTQSLFAAKHFVPNAKRLTFTMRSDMPRKIKDSKGVKHKILSLINQMISKYNVKNSDLIFCHYPDARKALINEGYKGPVIINTQIGVDTKHFKFRLSGRDRIREKYGFSDKYVFGSASRFNPEKGIFDILEALPENENVAYMILGSGNKDEEKAIREKIEKLGIRDRVFMPGLIGWDELPDYLSALDCALHVPHTTSRWKETFSLALVQAEAVAVPLIGNNSGSVPYQCGIDNLIVEEGNIQQLREKMNWAINHRELMKKYGEKQCEYVCKSFDIRILAEHFYSIIIQLRDGIEDIKPIDTAEGN